jgi:hypothetical protein
MTDIREIIRSDIRAGSERIKAIKDAVSELKVDAALTTRKNHINPKHKDWDDYRRLKIDVSLWLAALHMTNPSIDAETKEFLVGCHRPRGVDYGAFAISVAKKTDRLKERLAKEAEFAKEMPHA